MGRLFTLLLLVFAGLMQAGKPDADRLAGIVRNLNQMLRADSVLPAEDFVRLTRQRTAALADLIEASPADALALATNENRGEWEGHVEATVEDDFERRVSRTKWRIRLGDDSAELFFAAEAPQPRCGQRLRIGGLRVADRIAVASATLQPDAAPVFCSSTGQQNVAVLMVSFPHTPLPATLSASLLQAGFFGPARSLDSYWREVSYGKTSATGAVFGPFVLDADYTCDQTDAIRSAAIKAADSSVDFRSYTRIFIIVPNAGTCSLGYGLVGCTIYSSPSKGIFNASTSVLRADYLTSNDAVVSTASHEGGHNLGLEHASTLDYGSVPLGAIGATGVHDEYGDVYSAMAYSYGLGGGSFVIGHYAAPHKSQLGWFGAGNQQTVQSSGTFLLQPYETTATALQTIRVRRGTGNNYWLWLEYRQPTGPYDSTLGLFSNQAFSGALIHYDDPSNTPLRGYSQLLDFNPVATPNNFKVAPLTAGQSWSDPYSDLSIHVNSATPSGLSVSVNYRTVAAAGAISDSVFVGRLYQYILGRSPDAAGLSYWLTKLSGGETRGAIADEFLRSPEYAVYGLFIVSNYLGVLGREPDFAGYQYWFAQMRTAGKQQTDVIAGFLASPEYAARFGNPDTPTFVTELYSNVLGRSPDAAGFQYWTSLLNSGQITRPQAVQGFVGSAEFQATTLNQLYVELVYFALLNRAATPAELAAGKQALGAGQSTASFINTIVSGSEFLSRT